MTIIKLYFGSYVNIYKDVKRHEEETTILTLWYKTSVGYSKRSVNIFLLSIHLCYYATKANQNNRNKNTINQIQRKK